MHTREAAALLGVKPSEVATVDESDGGPVITTAAGVRYVVLAEGATDAEGKTGLMLLAAPSDAPVAVIDGRTCWNSFPLFVPWPDDEELSPVDASVKPAKVKQGRGKP